MRNFSKIFIRINIEGNDSLSNKAVLDNAKLNVLTIAMVLTYKAIDKIPDFL